MNWIERKLDGRLFYGGGDAGQAIAAGIYAASNILSWSHANDMPYRQADANKEVLALQKQHYDAISAEQRAILNAAIGGYLDSLNGLINGLDFEEALPEVPRAAEYVPVNPCCEQLATIECNIEHTERADAYARFVNRMTEQNDMVHLLSFCPDFSVNLDIMNKSIQDLMRGILSTGDVIEVISDGAERAAMQGRIGNTRKTTHRDLGIAKMRAQFIGRQEFRETIAWVNSTVSPVQRQVHINSMMLAPGDRLQLALTQHQLIQNSLQNKNNALAQKEPFLLAKLQAKMQRDITVLQSRASQALLVSTHVPNYASIVVPKMDNTAMLLGGIGSTVEHANRSHFFGPPAGAQDGFTGQSQKTTQSEARSREVSGQDEDSSKSGLRNWF